MQGESRLNGTTVLCSRVWRNAIRRSNTCGTTTARVTPGAAAARAAATARASGGSSAARASIGTRVIAAVASGSGAASALSAKATGNTIRRREAGNVAGAPRAAGAPGSLAAATRGRDRCGRSDTESHKRRPTHAFLGDGDLGTFTQLSTTKRTARFVVSDVTLTFCARDQIHWGPPGSVVSPTVCGQAVGGCNAAEAARR